MNPLPRKQPDVLPSGAFASRQHQASLTAPIANDEARQPVTERQYFNPAEAAIILGFSKQALALWRSQGRGPAWSKPAGGRIVYRREDLDAFVAAGRREPLTAEER